MCGFYLNKGISYVSRISLYLPGFGPGSKSAKMAKTQETPAVKKDGRLTETAEISERAEILQALRLAGIYIYLQHELALETGPKILTGSHPPAS